MTKSIFRAFSPFSAGFRPRFLPRRNSGGADFQAAKELGVEICRAPGLPGKWAPLSAAQAIRDGIGRILRKEGIL